MQSIIQLTHQNAEASMPLHVSVPIDCNTPDDRLIENVKTNSARPGEWVKVEEAHGRTAVICGSGPSLRETSSQFFGLGGSDDIFALNGTAKYLAELGFKADYQVLLDARRDTAALIGPAKNHLFASQVDPKCFELVPSAKVWHADIGCMFDILPEREEEFAMIGASTSVGLTAMCLAYAMGYRKFELYGYDSSHKDAESHAFPQPINDGEPCLRTSFNGKHYYTSFTMKLQADEFAPIAKALIAAGCTINVHGTGLLPDRWNAPVEVLTEAEKYARIWEHPEYRVYSPGEECAADFLRIVNPIGTVIDFGCGTGRGALAIKKAGVDVILCDFASNCRDPEAVGLPFFQVDLTQPIPLQAPYGFCTDVLEHIPTENVVTVVKNIMHSARTVFFQISTVPDRSGGLINQTLHLTVKPHRWWIDLFQKHYRVECLEFDRERESVSQFVITKRD